MKLSATILCNNILKRAFDEKIPINPMKLQRLLYYVCRNYTKQVGCSPVNESFEVWRCGPVLVSVQNQFEDFGSKPIKKYARDAMGTAYVVDESKIPILASILDIVWGKYKMMSAMELARIAYGDGSGWYRAFQEWRKHITEEDMKCDETGWKGGKYD